MQSRSIRNNTGLKFGKELAVPVLALSQLSRAVEQRDGLAFRSLESGSIEQDADVVMFVFRVLLFKK